MANLDAILPRGKQSLFQSMRDAGISSAPPQRNVAWVNAADDGAAVLNVWRYEIDVRQGLIVAVIAARTWETSSNIKERKRVGVVARLEALHGLRIRVVILESKKKRSSRHAGTQYDRDAEWLVEDTGDEFLLWRARDSLQSSPVIPSDPEGYGHLNPSRRILVSEQIERDARVRARTLKRAGHRCEIADCSDGQDFASVDVHHITSLGNGGSDHTDNTVALCPACHNRVHRGTRQVKAALDKKLLHVRARRAAAQKTVPAER